MAETHMGAFKKYRCLDASKSIPGGGKQAWTFYDLKSYTGDSRLKTPPLE